MSAVEQIEKVTDAEVVNQTQVFTDLIVKLQK